MAYVILGGWHIRRSLSEECGHASYHLLSDERHERMEEAEARVEHVDQRAAAERQGGG